MATLDSGKWTEGDDISSELEELHVEALRFILIVVAALAIYTHYFISAAANGVNPTHFGFMWAVIGTAGLAYWTLRFGAVTATSILVVGLSAIVVVALLVFHAPLLAFWFSPIVIVGGVLIGWRSAVGIAVLASAVTLIDQSGPAPMSGDVATGSLLLTWFSLLICWLLSHPTRTALDWAWHSYVRAMHIAEELRDHQEQLERTVKSLHVAYKRLEQLNVELARARQAAEQARRLKAEFAAAISHELRTPLNLIIGFSEMMVTTPQAYRGQILPDVYRGDLEAIYRNACHLSNLVDDVLDLSQIEADRMGLQKEQVRLAPVVDEAVTTIARLFHAKGLAITVEVPLDLPAVYVDRTRIRQVLINLLNNAARFTSVGGVTIRAWSEGADVIVAVADTGIGIAPEHLTTVFEEFRQIHVLGERRTVGSGLGLAVSKRFVELHGGSMWVESRLGEGSTFSFSLPTCESVITASGYPEGDRWVPPSRGSDGDRAILVIDRDGDAARLFGRHLDGYHVLAARGIESARRLGAESVIQAAVMVGPSGAPDWLAIRRIGEIFPEVPVVICSLSTRKVTARELGAADCLAKPVGREQIRLALRRLGRHVRTVLIVDDDPEMVRLLGRLVRLTSRRYVIREAQTGREALALLETERPDAVLLDLVMPDLSGDEFLRRMRETPGLRDVPVILVTGHGLTDETVTAEFFGITQRGGLSVRELMRCLRTSLEAVHRPQTALLQHLQQCIPADRLGQEVGSSHGQGERALVHDGADDDRNVARRAVTLEGL